jgi:hypothetical protein
VRSCEQENVANIEAFSAHAHIAWKLASARLAARVGAKLRFMRF